MIKNGAVTTAGAGGGSSNNLVEGLPLAPSKIIYDLFFFASQHCVGIKFSLNWVSHKFLCRPGGIYGRNMYHFLIRPHGDVVKW
jgi:hypothetical protein